MGLESCLRNTARWNGTFRKQKITMTGGSNITELPYQAETRRLDEVVVRNSTRSIICPSWRRGEIILTIRSCVIGMGGEGREIPARALLIAECWRKFM
jgi:hypothetical protein